MSRPIPRTRPYTIALIVLALALVGVVGASIFLLAVPPLHLPNDSVTAVLHLEFSPDGTKLLTSGFAVPVRLWDTTTGARLRELPMKGAMTTAFAPGGQTFAISTLDSTIILYDLLGNKRPFAPPFANAAHPFRTVSELRYSPNGKWLAANVEDVSIRLWRTDTGQQAHDLTGHFSHIAFSPDSRLLAACAYDCIHIWEVATGKLLRQVPLTAGFTSHFIAFSPDCRTIIGTNLKQVLAWDAATGKPIPRFSAPRNGYNLEGVFTPDGKYILIRHESQGILLFEAATGRQVATLFGESWKNHLPQWLLQWVPALRPPRSLFLWGIALSPDGKRLAYSADTDVWIVPCNFR